MASKAARIARDIVDEVERHIDYFDPAQLIIDITAALEAEATRAFAEGAEAQRKRDASRLWQQGRAAPEGSPTRSALILASNMISGSPLAIRALSTEPSGQEANVRTGAHSSGASSSGVAAGGDSGPDRGVGGVPVASPPLIDGQANVITGADEATTRRLMDGQRLAKGGEPTEDMVERAAKAIVNNHSPNWEDLTEKSRDLWRKDAADALKAAMAASPAPALPDGWREPLAGLVEQIEFSLKHWPDCWTELLEERIADCRVLLAASPQPPTPQHDERGMVPAGWRLVPEIDTEEMWGGLARQLVLWRDMTPHNGQALHWHLRNSHIEIPGWLTELIPDTNHSPSKGAVCGAIWRAMLEACPTPPAAVHDAQVTGLGITRITEGGIEHVDQGGFYTAPAEEGPEAAKPTGDPKPYVIRKRGLFYRWPANGYTTEICAAGRYTKEEAEKLVDQGSGVTMHLVSEYERPNGKGG